WFHSLLQWKGTQKGTGTNPRICLSRWQIQSIQVGKDRDYPWSEGKGDWQGIVYMPLGFFGLMVISYFGKVADRSKRALYVFISALGTLTLAAYAFSNLSTTGCFFLQVIRKAHAFTTSQQVSNTPFHFFSSADQHRSMRLYLL